MRRRKKVSAREEVRDLFGFEIGFTDGEWDGFRANWYNQDTQATTFLGKFETRGEAVRAIEIAAGGICAKAT